MAVALPNHSQQTGHGATLVGGYHHKRSVPRCGFVDAHQGGGVEGAPLWQRGNLVGVIICRQFYSHLGAKLGIKWLSLHP